MAETITPAQAGLAKKPKGSGFTNLSRFLGANQENKLGSAVAAGVRGEAEKASSGLQSAKGQFEQERVAKRIGDEDEQALVSGALQSAAQGNVSDEQAAGFKNIMAGYQGPKNLANEAALSANAQRAQALGQNVQSRGGRQDLLSRFAAKGPYTAGQQRLDEALLGRTGAKDIQGARRATVGLENQFQQEAAAARTAGEQEAINARAFADKAAKDVETAAGAIDTAAQNELKAFNENEAARSGAASSLSSNWQKYASSGGLRLTPNPQTGQLEASVNPELASSISSAVNSGLLSQADADFLSQSILDGSANLAALAPNQASPFSFNAGQLATDKSQFLTPERAASLNALAKLSGKDGTYAASNANLAKSTGSLDQGKLKEQVRSGYQQTAEYRQAAAQKTQAPKDIAFLQQGINEATAKIASLEDQLRNTGANSSRFLSLASELQKQKERLANDSARLSSTQNQIAALDSILNRY